MNSQKRLAVFVVSSVVLMVGMQLVMERLGLNPKPVPIPPAAPAGQAAARPGAPPIGDETKPAAGATPPPLAANPGVPEPTLVDPSLLVLGSSRDQDRQTGYRMELRFDQVGAGVRELLSAQYDGETNDGIPDRGSKLELITDDPTSRAPRSLTLALIPPDRTAPGRSAPSGEIALDTVRWDVLRSTPEAPAVRTISRIDPGVANPVEGQEISFVARVDSPKSTVTKTYRLWKGEDGFDYVLKFAGDAETSTSYRLFGPHGIPIEGESFTANFRDIFFGLVKNNATEIITRPASDIYKYRDKPETFEALPVNFAGVENQYFTVFVEPVAGPSGARIVRKAQGMLAKADEKASQKSDVGVELTSEQVDFGPNRPAEHTYKIYAGPKRADLLASYGASELASYRKNQWFNIPFASSLAQYVIAPLLGKIYNLTTQVSQIFGGTSGNYGIAIILLTMTVRLIMFPVGRKQALISKKMQDLQPALAEIKERYKDDKERQTKETFALYKQHGFNPAAGCLPALIQLPIFVGLWQALNNSVALRHSQFLYIRNLAAPDMLFNFGTDLPVVGQYFNLLPFLVVGLMLLQTKLFTPPPMTEEARSQQKVMKIMMIFMAFMFYKVPSGLGIYFITSSLWQVCERLLLPKITKSKPLILVTDDHGLPVNGSAKSGVGGWLSKKMEKLLEEAANERTIRNSGTNGSSNNGGRNQTPDRDRNRPRPKPPGKRR